MQYGIGIIVTIIVVVVLLSLLGLLLRARFKNPFAGKRGSMKGSSRRDKHEAFFMPIGSSF